MGIFKKAVHSKIDVFVKFESAVNPEIRGQIKKKDSFYLGDRDLRDTASFIKIWVRAVWGIG